MNFYELFEVTSHKTFEEKLEQLLSDKEEREAMYDRLISAGADLNKDLFLEYFEAYNAEKKSNRQDFTPPVLARLMAKVGPKEVTELYDGAAGTGSLLVAQWAEAKGPITLQATERSDAAIPYLVHNLAIRNISAEIIHGDTLTGEVFDVYRTVPGERYAEIIHET